MTGLPTPPATLAAMLPSDTLAGTAALVVGAGFVAETAAAGLKEIGAEVSRTDLADPEAVQRTVGSTGADVLLVVTPDLSEPEHADGVSLGSWRSGPGAMLESAFGALAAFGAVRGDNGGVALVTVDPVALHGGPGVAAAAGAQAALVGLVQSLAVEWSPRDLRINALAAGGFGGAGRAGPPGNIPALRLGEARELAWMVQYLCSPYAAYLTGTTLTVDGGDSLKRYLLEPVHTRDEFLRGGS
ncbi:SDR family oxidoreductase [Streptomyces flaveolus]|uniref:SDR family oxidoreductase n=1 Tax=Streptomyces flaveolus TaxID=67297 RepID=UPI00380189FB